MARRSKGEGTLYYSRYEKRWIAKITLSDGRRVQKRSKDKEVVSDWLFEQRKAVLENRPMVDDKITFNDFADRFLSDVAKHTMKETTYSSYVGYLKLHIRPELGKMKLAAIQPHHIQRLYTKKLDSGLSNKTVHNIHSYLRRILNQAVKWELILRNPCSAVTPPKFVKKPPNVWTVEQAQTFLSAVAEHRWHAIYLIALTTGARRGEILGMEWENLNWDKGTVSIKRTVVELEGRTVITEPKTKQSRRVIALPNMVLDLLKENPTKSGFIFQSEAGTPVHPRNLLRHYYSVLDTLDIPRIRFHDLRHTAATILLQKDTHPVKVQHLLGHSSITTTLDVYSHVLPPMKSEVAEKMDEIFK